MRISRVCLGWALAIALPAAAAAQATAPKPSEAEDKDRAVAGGGITVPGWTGKVDAKGTAAGLRSRTRSSRSRARLHLTSDRPRPTGIRPTRPGLLHRQGHLHRAQAGIQPSPPRLFIGAPSSALRSSR